MRLALVALCLTLATYEVAGSCFQDSQQCLTDFKALLADNDAFWFGASYQIRCPPGNTDKNCNDPEPDVFNLLDRFFGIGAAPSLNTLQLADVRYTAPAAEVFACGHAYSVPALQDERVDPLVITNTSLWSVNNGDIQVTWPAETGKQYMVIIWDGGVYYLHGLYINCAAGNLDSCTPVSPYSGPLNPSPFAQPYIFVVLEQDRTLDFTTVLTAMNNVRFANEFRFRYTPFSAQVPTGNLVAATILNIKGDIYGAQKLKEFGMFNYCPNFISQEKLLRTVLDRAGVQGQWSDMVGGMQAVDGAVLNSLELSLDLIYYTKETKFESCCKEYSFPPATVVPDPISPQTPELPVHVFTQPFVSIKPMDVLNFYNFNGKQYVLMMVDFGSISEATRPGSSYIVQWVVSDIPPGRFEKGNVVVPYAGSTPFRRDDPGMFAFLLFEQPQTIFNPEDMRPYIDTTFFPCPDFRATGCMYRVADMITGLGLGDIKGVTWFVAEQDAFVRQRVYNEFFFANKSVTCAGIPGYSDPCPLSCEDIAEQARNNQQTILSVCLAAALQGGQGGQGGQMGQWGQGGQMGQWGQMVQPVMKPVNMGKLICPPKSPTAKLFWPSNWNH